MKGNPKTKLREHKAQSHILSHASAARLHMDGLVACRLQGMWSFPYQRGTTESAPKEAEAYDMDIEFGCSVCRGIWGLSQADRIISLI